MPLVHLPKTCDVFGLLSRFDAEGVLDTEWDVLSLHLPKKCFLASSALTFLAAWGKAQVEAGRQIRLTGDPDTARYLARMDFHSHLGIQYDYRFQRHNEQGRFLPLSFVTNGDDTWHTVNAICELVLHQFENAAELVPAVQWMIYEVIDNVVTHAQAPVPGVVYAQSFPKRGLLDIAVCDVGQGIKASLAAKHPTRSHGQAIKKALERGVTDGEGCGTGLAGTHEIAEKNGGELQLWSGDVVYQLKNGKAAGFQPIPDLQGTGVVLRLDTKRPVRLADTWIAPDDEEWTYLDAEAERLSDGDGIRIQEACLHTGGRSPARRLRNKINALLESLEEPLVLDFTGVTMASSSFLDELLGRFVEQHGGPQLGDILNLKGMTPEIRHLTNAVLHQRLGAGQ